MVDTPEKLSNNHAHDSQSCGFLNKMPQLFEHDLQPAAVGQLESLPDTLVKRFAQGSVLQSAIASTSAVLQAADEMKVAELNDPALARAESDNSRNLVGDRGTDASVNGGGNGCECLRPTLHVLSPWQEHRIEEDSSILMARLDRHHIQNPIFSSKAEVKSVQDQNQGASGQSQRPRSRHAVSQASTKTSTQALRGKSVAWRQSFQGATIQQHCFENSRTRWPRLAATSFLADSPRPFALTALTTSRTEMINFGFATWRFRVPRMHARELDTDYWSKYPKTRLNSV